jgi:Ca2+-binding EF-hand superfamily protein
MHIKYLVSAAALLSSVAFSQAYAQEEMSVQDKMQLATRQNMRHNMQQSMLEADTNKDGKISYEEFKAEHEKRGQAHFKNIDLNSDGFIDESERKAFHELMQERRQDPKGRMRGDRQKDLMQDRTELR